MVFLVSVEEMTLKGFISDRFKMSFRFIYQNAFGYPISTLFRRQYAQHTDIINTMHTMHKGRMKIGSLEYAIKLDS